MRSNTRRNVLASVCLAGASLGICGLATAADDQFVNVSVLQDGPQGTSLRFDFAEPTVNQIRIDGAPWSVVRLGNESITAPAGAPSLPDVSRSVSIPGDAAVQVRMIRGTYRDLEGFSIAPSKGTIYRDTNPADVPYTFGEVYDTEGFWPTELATMRDPHIIRNARGVVVTVNPLQWNPATGTLRVWQSMEVAVDVVGTTTKNILPQFTTAKDNAAFELMYANHFVNWPAERRYDPLDFSGDILVIAADQFVDNMQPFADYKNGTGRSTTIIPVSQIGNSSGAIDSYIGGMYLDGNLAYVVIVGDAQHVAAPSAAGGLSDPLYAKISADDYPDLFISRMSGETDAHIDTQVERAIRFEQDQWVNHELYKRAAGIASNQGPGDDGETDNVHVANIMSQLEDDYGYTYTTVIADPSGTVSQGVAAINSGLGAIAYTGHGSTTCWGNGAPLCNSDVDGLTNTEMLPWIISVACVNGEYNAGTCFAEAFVRATHNGMPSGATMMYAATINQSWSPPMCAQDETFDLFCDERYATLGALCFGGSSQMMDEYGSDGVDMYDTWHIFGDCSLIVVGTAEPPAGMAVSGSGFAAEGPLGGPFSPNTAEFTITNYDDVAYEYGVDVDVAWADLAQVGGTVPGGGTATIVVVLNSQANSLGNGMHMGNVTFTDETNGGELAVKPISVNVGVPVEIYSWPLDSNPGWSATGEWAFGQPTGNGGGSYGMPDPSSGATGSNVYGVNLNGDYSGSQGSAMFLTTELIDCSSIIDVELKFQRWLNSDYQPYVTQRLEISADGTNWTSIFDNGDDEMTASSWSEQVHDISDVADGEPAVRVRWSHQVTQSGAWAYSGWNVDDVAIWGVDVGSEPCEGDYNGDGMVGATDILQVLGEWGSYNTDDILLIIANWGSEC
ncbi:MAG: C25 family cysteine peptidase [Phycisphaerales bacterium]|nr:C25 family cysteine peptidase [Phycisphaerales bacterium]